MSDLISRQDAINEIKNVFDDVLCCNVSVRKGLPEVVRRIEMMPSSDRPTGEWVEIEDYAGGIHYQCDKCKEEFILMYGTPKENGYNYCPACGAKMEEKNGKFNKKE